MLFKLMRTHLAPYKKLLWLIVVLQTVQTAAALSLPTINARIIDNGVLTGNVGYIWTWGGIMLCFTLVQVVFATGAVFYGGAVVSDVVDAVRALSSDPARDIAIAGLSAGAWSASLGMTLTSSAG